MGKDKVSPPVKNLPAKEGIQEGNHSTLTTPKSANGRYWSSGKEENSSLMGRKK